MPPLAMYTAQTVPGSSRQNVGKWLLLFAGPAQSRCHEHERAALTFQLSSWSSAQKCIPATRRTCVTSATTLLMSGGSCWRSRNGATERSWQTARQVLHLVLACLWPHCDLASTKCSTAASQAHSKPPGSPAETFMAGMLLIVVDICQ